jgi:hypothetical protein
MEHIEVVVADGSVRIEAVILVVAFYSMRVVFDSFFIIFVFEGLVALLFPIFC